MPTIYQSLINWQEARAQFFAGLNALIMAAWDEFDVTDAERGYPDNDPVVEGLYDAWLDLVELRRKWESETFGL